MYEYLDLEDLCVSEGASEGMSLLRGESHWPGIELWLSGQDFETEAQ